MKMKRVYFFAAYLLVLSASAFVTYAETVGPLTFNTIDPKSGTQMQEVSVPGFRLRGGRIGQWDGVPSERFYQGLLNNCSTCFWPVTLETAPGAKHLTFKVFTYDLVRVTDGVWSMEIPPFGAAYPLGFTVTIPESTGTTYITAVSVFGFPGFAAIDDIVYEHSKTDRYVRLVDETPGLAVAVTDRKIEKDIIKAQVALGSVFSLALAEKQSPLEPTQELVAVFVVEDGALSPLPAPVDNDALFATGAVTAFHTPAPSTRQRFMATHLGSRRIRVRPLSDSGPATTVEITVVQPIRLGSGPNTWDDRVIRYAHRRGLPPQVLKGLMQQETHFDPESYRYEPFVTDWDTFSPHAGDNKVDKEPYKFYRMETGNLARGTKLSSKDIDQRVEYDIQRPGDPTVRRVMPQDQNVTAYELYRYNDYEDKNFQPRLDQRWYEILSSDAKRSLIDARAQEVLNYNAQTTIAASYGIMQVLYTSAIEIAHWKGDVDGRMNPEILHDTTEHLAKDGGSISPGSTILRKAFITNMKAVPAWYTKKNGPPPAAWVWPPVTVADWEYMWKLGLSQYNGKSQHRRTPTGYGNEAYPRSLKFVPVRPVPVFTE